MVLANVGRDVCAAIFAISALWAFSAAANAGAKCLGSIDSKGGSANGVDHLPSSGLPGLGDRRAGNRLAVFALLRFFPPLHLPARVVTAIDPSKELPLLFISAARTPAASRQIVPKRQQTKKMGRWGNRPDHVLGLGVLGNGCCLIRPDPSKQPRGAGGLRTGGAPSGSGLKGNDHQGRNALGRIVVRGGTSI